MNPRVYDDDKKDIEDDSHWEDDGNWTPIPIRKQTYRDLQNLTEDETESLDDRIRRLLSEYKAEEELRERG